MPAALEDLARRALDGDRDAVEHLVTALRGDVYGLALRMLWNREDAEDATQEILVRAVTRLSQFDFRSRLKTWVYRTAVNYILDVKKSSVERMHLNFQQFGDDLVEGLSAAGLADAECLSAELFRKRLQHARTAIEAFTRAHCGLASDRAACARHRRVPAAVRLGRVHPDALDFAGRPSSYRETREFIRRAEQARWAFQVHRTSHPRSSAVDFARSIAQSFDSRQDP